jgi:hypothetical protein
MGIFDSFQNKKDGGISFKDQLLTLTDVVAPSAVSISPRSINISGVNAQLGTGN